MGAVTLDSLDPFHTDEALGPEAYARLLLLLRGWVASLPQRKGCPGRVPRVAKLERPAPGSAGGVFPHHAALRRLGPLRSWRTGALARRHRRGSGPGLSGWPGRRHQPFVRRVTGARSAIGISVYDNNWHPECRLIRRRTRSAADGRGRGVAGSPHTSPPGGGGAAADSLDEPPRSSSCT
jgi:hypothetical protein